MNGKMQTREVFDPVGNIIKEEKMLENVINIDFGKSEGEIRAINGLCNGPGIIVAGQDSDLVAYWEVLNVPTTRLHDTVYNENPDTVDIHCIFPDFNADPEDPESYHFKRTDKYIKAIVDAGVQIIYRLGESIDHSADKCYIDPPENYEQWAKICIGIIKHYNKGWADGFRYNIKYWEIWNEPEQGAMWTGSHQQYCDMYRVAAKAIKAYDNTLKVGGPSSSGSIPLQELLLSECKKHNIPLDFYSFHRYSLNPRSIKRIISEKAKILNDFGFKDAELHLNEWHYFKGDWGRMKDDSTYCRELFNRINGPEAAAFIASALMIVQDSEIDMTNYYTGDTSTFGLFDAYKVPHKTYYAFKAFAWLLEQKNRVECKVYDYNIQAMVAMDKDKKTAVLLLSNFDDNENDAFAVNVANSPFAGAMSYEVYSVDEKNNLYQISRHRISTEEKRFVVHCPTASIKLIKFFWK